MNPLSQDLGVMRQTLLFGGLETIQHNANRKHADLKLYEFGNCYHYVSNPTAKEHNPNNPLVEYSEELHLGIWLTGNKTAQTWVHKDEKTTFYQLRAYVNAVLIRMGVNLDKCTLESMQSDLYSDGLTIKAANGKVIGFMAIVHPKVAKVFDMEEPIYYADLDWNQLLKQNKQYKAVINDLPKFPEVKRDFALLVDKQVEFAALARAAFETERKLLKNVYLFDVYEGKNLEAGKKSYALSFILQDSDNTLKDKQIEAIMSKLQKTFEEKFGAKLR
jgi:phenylalanyl-tRNA synthetase beta chain